MSLSLSSTVLLRFLWPVSPLRKSSHEEYDNALAWRLQVSGWRMVFLNKLALSKQALSLLLESRGLVAELEADVVQIVGQPGKVFPASLSNLLFRLHPTLLVLMPMAASTTQGRKPVQVVPVGAWRTYNTRILQKLTLRIESSGSWSLSV